MAWDKVGQQLDEEDFAVKCLQYLIRNKPDTSKEDIGKEYDRLRSEGYFG